MPACPLPADEALRQRTLDDMNLVDTPAEHYLDTLVRLTQDLAHVDTVLISLIDQDRQWFKARIGLEASETTRRTSPSWAVRWACMSAMPSSPPPNAR